MDRVTATRNNRPDSQPHRPSGPGGVSACVERALAAVGDYIHAEDVADAIIATAFAASALQRHNVAAGVTATAGDLITWAAEKALALGRRSSRASRPTSSADPTLTGGMWSACDALAHS